MTRNKMLLAAFMLAAMSTACAHENNHLLMADSKHAHETKAIDRTMDAPPVVHPWEEESPDSEY